MKDKLDEAVEQAARVACPDAWERGASPEYQDRARASVREILEAAGFEALLDTAEEYHRLIENLQGLGERFGCVGGANRMFWLSERLEKLHALEQQIALKRSWLG